MKLLAVVLSCILLLLVVLCFYMPQFDLRQEPDSTISDFTNAPTESSETIETYENVTSEPTQSFIEESTACTSDIQQEAQPDNDDFVRVFDYIPNVRVSLQYATEDNFTGVPIYAFTDAYLRYGTVLKLADAAEQLSAMGYGLVIWDGYRPYYAQEKLWQICPDPTYVSKPGTGSQSHCRGLAVDITLYDLKTNEFLEMPTGFDDFSALADRDYSDCTAEAAYNASLLEEVMKNCGFKPYKAEWWHYSDTDTYPVEYDFDPAKLAH